MADAPRVTTLRLTLCLVVMGIVAAFPSVAAAATSTPVSPSVEQPSNPDVPPAGYSTSVRQADAIAERTPEARKAMHHYHGVKVAAFARNDRWEVDFYDSTTVRAEIIVSKDGKLIRSWSGLAARAPYTRGQYGGPFEKPWIFIPFGLLFLAPFVDRRRPFRMLHLDLAVMLSFGISYAIFARANPEPAVWLVYPPLFYLLARMLWIGFGRSKRPAGRLSKGLPTVVLMIGLAVLIGGRIGVSLGAHEPIDVGYASVIGADRINHGLPLYVDNDQHGDTYGPVNYLAYVPFEMIFPWDGEWNFVPAAHVAAIFFDLMTILGLFLLGRRLRAGPDGRRLGLLLAWAWAAYPFTLLNLGMSSNDGLVAMLLVYTLLGLASPWARGAVLGAAAAAKFIPGALLPLIALKGGGRGKRDVVATVVSCVGIFVFALAVYWPAGGLREFWNCTLGYQLDRLPDFSIWGITEHAGWTQTVLQVAAVALAFVVALVPGKRTTAQVAALGAAVTIAFQIPAGHWFYFYIVWFVPFVFVALLARDSDPVVDAPEPAAEAEPDFPTHRFAAELTAS